MDLVPGVAEGVQALEAACDRHWVLGPAGRGLVHVVHLFEDNLLRHVWFVLSHEKTDVFSYVWHEENIWNNLKMSLLYRLS